MCPTGKIDRAICQRHQFCSERMGWGPRANEREREGEGRRERDTQRERR